MNAFVPAVPLPLTGAAASRLPTTSPRHAVSMTAADKMSRRTLLAAAGCAAVAGALGQIAPAMAGPASGLESAVAKKFFPKEGYNAPEKTTAATTKVSADVMSTPEAKEALKKLQEISTQLLSLTSAFEGNPKFYNLADELQRGIKVDDIRSALNTVLDAFDEETQKTTDKLARGIIQDLSELIYNSSIAPGVTSGRTPNRIDRIAKWLAKINGDFNYLLSFYN